MLRELLDDKMPLSDSFVPSLSLDGDILALPTANKKKVLFYQLQFDRQLHCSSAETHSNWLVCYYMHCSPLTPDFIIGKSGWAL